MNEKQLYRDISNYCKAHADKTVAVNYGRYFKEGYDAYGLTEKLITDKIDAILKDTSVNINLILKTAQLLIKSGKHEETWFAILLLKPFAQQFDLKTFKAVEKWFDYGIINWAHCDVFCSLLMKEFFASELIALENIADWRTATNKHQRRAVPVSMLNFLKTAKDYKHLFKFIEPLMQDPEEKVQQGLGWFLREAWKLKPQQTEEFLLKWKDLSPRKIFQYATEKMTPQNKLRFKKQK